MDTFAERALTLEERAIAEWLLTHAGPLALEYLPQLDVVRVTGMCDCGCPTINLLVPTGTTPAPMMENPIGDAFATVGGKEVGVMLLQREGFLVCLEVYDLSDIEHPYGLPDVASLVPAEWNKT